MGIIGGTTLATIVEAGVSAVLDRPAFIWATLVGWFNVMVGWINLTYLLFGLGGTALLLLGVAMGRNIPKKVTRPTSMPRQMDVPPDDPHATWIDTDTALALLRRHLLVGTIAKRMHEAGQAGLVGATHEVAEMALEEFAQGFPSSTKVIGNRHGGIDTVFARADLLSWADQNFASSAPSNPEPGEPDA